jgi:hypothetical protein
VFEGSDQDFARLQASQKLDRRELSVLERAMYVAAVAEAAQRRLLAQHGGITQQALAGKAVQRGPTWTALPMTKARRVAAMKWRQSMPRRRCSGGARRGLWLARAGRDACGLSLTALKRALTIHRCLVVPHRALIEAIKEHPASNNQSLLLKIAGMAEPGRAYARCARC